MIDHDSEQFGRNNDDISERSSNPNTTNDAYTYESSSDNRPALVIGKDKVAITEEGLEVGPDVIHFDNDIIDPKILRTEIQLQFLDDLRNYDIKKLSEVLGVNLSELDESEVRAALVDFIDNETAALIDVNENIEALELNRTDFSPERVRADLLELGVDTSNLNNEELRILYSKTIDEQMENIRALSLPELDSNALDEINACADSIRGCQELIFDADGNFKRVIDSEHFGRLESAYVASQMKLQGQLEKALHLNDIGDLNDLKLQLESQKENLLIQNYLLELENEKLDAWKEVNEISRDVIESNKEIIRGNKGLIQSHEGAIRTITNVADGGTDVLSDAPLARNSHESRKLSSVVDDGLDASSQLGKTPGELVAEGVRKGEEAAAAAWSEVALLAGCAKFMTYMTFVNGGFSDFAMPEDAGAVAGAGAENLMKRWGCWMRC